MTPSSLRLAGGVMVEAIETDVPAPPTFAHVFFYAESGVPEAGRSKARRARVGARVGAKVGASVKAPA